ncbi:glutaredoxin family protein, partial [Mediterraneibacter gnavus]|uniref:glutaredoxin family protein n=1 Tax=Mediterraneibacter gnavus TaxID=33038 RepID=UPI001FA88330
GEFQGDRTGRRTAYFRRGEYRGRKSTSFTTKTCPNCKLAKDSLEKANISYEVVDAGENEELVRKYGVMQAPTLIVIKEEGVQKLANASNIRAFAEKR